MVHNDFTMVRRSDRGNGHAVVVKRRLTAEAAASAIDGITTEVRNGGSTVSVRWFVNGYGTGVEIEAAQTTRLSR